MITRVIERLMRHWKHLTHSTSQSDFIPCAGCDGHECVSECKYPGMTQDQLDAIWRERAKERAEEAKQ